jgi:hypothetical protein
MQVPAKKVTWVQIKDNPSGIGSSIAFGSTQQNVSPPIIVEEQTETIIVSPQPQQQSMNTEELVQHTIEAALEVATLDHGTTSQDHGEECNAHSDHIPATTSHLVTLITCNPITLVNTFSMQLDNVSNEMVRNDMEGNHKFILSSVKEKTLDVSSIVIPDDVLVDSVLQKDIDFMQTWLAKAVVNDAPFTQVVSKSQKKKLQKASYQTRSQGSLPSSK